MLVHVEVSGSVVLTDTLFAKDMRTHYSVLIRCTVDGTGACFMFVIRVDVSRLRSPSAPTISAN